MALSEWVRTIAYCEIDPYCQAVLLSRISEGNIRNAPIWDNIITLESKLLSTSIDIIYGGFPCQDISSAGHGKGLEGQRSGLFFEIIRLAKEIKPSFIFLENVPAITIRGGLTVVRTIAEMGYDCRWCVISASSVGALHRRERWFLLANANKKCEFGLFIRKNEEIPFFGVNEENMANPRCVCERCLQEPGKEDRTSFHHPRCGRFWETEPDVGRVVDGLSQRVDRLRGLGNAVVPRQAKEAFKILMGLK